MPIRPSVDLRQLRVFEALFRQRSVSRVADSLQITQPAVSMALAKLRTFYGDPLFVRTGQSMQPTPRAESMAPQVRAALDLLEAAASAAPAFDPARSARRFRLALGDVGKLLVLPRLMSLLDAKAPAVSLEVSNIGGSTPEAVEAGDVDLAFGYLEARKSSLYRQALFEDHFVCIRARDQARPLTPDVYEAGGHVSVTNAGTSAQLLSALLDRKRVQRRIRLVMPSYFALAEVVSTSASLATIPSRMAEILQSLHPLRVDPLPYLPAPSYVISQNWHARHHADAGHRWLRGLIGSSFATTAAGFAQSIFSPSDRTARP